MQTRPRPVKYRRKNKLRFEHKPGKPNLELRPYQVVLRPLVTEKGTHQSTRSVKINALQDERLPHGAALLREFAIETLPGDVVHGLISAVTRWSVSTVEQFPIAVLTIDLPGDFLT